MQTYEYSLKSDPEEQEVGLAEWIKNSKVVGCLWVKQAMTCERYDFDVSTHETKYLIYCCRRSISAFCPTICCLHLKCSRTRSDASGTTPPSYHTNESRVFK
jgi:hypothetical protein